MVSGHHHVKLPGSAGSSIVFLKHKKPWTALDTCGGIGLSPKSWVPIYKGVGKLRSSGMQAANLVLGSHSFCWPYISNWLENSQSTWWHTRIQVSVGLLQDVCPGNPCQLGLTGTPRNEMGR